MRGAEHGAQRVCDAAGNAVTTVTNENRAAESFEDTARLAAGVSPLLAPAAKPRAFRSRIGAAETQRRNEIVERFHATGDWTWKQIGAAVGMSPDRIQRWWEAQQRRARGEPAPRVRVYRQPGDVALKPGETRRLCMTCGKPFASQGPHNRLCADHRAAGGGSPYAPDPGGTVGRQVQARKSRT